MKRHYRIDVGVIFVTAVLLLSVVMPSVSLAQSTSQTITTGNISMIPEKIISESALSDIKYASADSIMNNIASGNISALPGAKVYNYIIRPGDKLPQLLPEFSKTLVGKDIPADNQYLNTTTPLITASSSGIAAGYQMFGDIFTISRVDS